MKPLCIKEESGGKLSPLCLDGIGRMCFSKQVLDGQPTSCTASPSALPLRQTGTASPELYEGFNFRNHGHSKQVLKSRLTCGQKALASIQHSLPESVRYAGHFSRTLFCSSRIPSSFEELSRSWRLFTGDAYISFKGMKSFPDCCAHI